VRLRREQSRHLGRPKSLDAPEPVQAVAELDASGRCIAGGGASPNCSGIGVVELRRELSRAEHRELTLGTVYFVHRICWFVAETSANESGKLLRRQCRAVVEPLILIAS